MQTIPARQDPKFNNEILKTAAWFRKNRPSAERRLKQAGLAVMGILTLVAVISTFSMYDSDDSKRSWGRTTSYYCEDNDIAYYPSCPAKVGGETEEKLDTSDLLAVFMHHVPMVASGGFWTGNSLVFLLLVLRTANPALLRIAARRTKRSNQAYEQMKASAEEEARRQLYVVTGLTANTRNVKVSGCPLAKPSSTFTDHIVSRQQSVWVPGLSRQSVAWFPDAYYNSVGILHQGGTVIVMSPANDLGLPTDMWGMQDSVEAFTERLNHDVTVFNKM